MIARLVFLAILLLSARALAAPPTATPGARQAELLERARAAEAAFDPAGAERIYAELLDTDSGSRLARRARVRLEWLRERSEGGYGPLTAMMRFSARPRAELTRAEVDAFAREVESFPPGRVKRESLSSLADTYLFRLADPERALALYHAWQECPDLGAGERELAGSRAALARAQLSGDRRSLEELERAGLSHRAEAVYLSARYIGSVGRWPAVLGIALFLVVGTTRARRGLGVAAVRRALSPARLALGAWVLGVPLLLMWLYDWRLAPQFATVIGAATGIALVASVFGAAMTRDARRGLVSGLAAVATVCAAFVALDSSRLLFDILLAMEQTR